MKAQKSLMVLATVSLLGLSVGCQGDYQEAFASGKEEGYRLGYDDGYDDGYLDGDEAGFERAKTFFASADYNSGFSAGKESGISIGYNQGYSAGKTDGTAIGYTSGYSAGKTDGYAIGKTDGYNLGYDDGYLDGEEVSYTAGYDAGYDDGTLDGYDLGYDDGFLDGYDVGYDDGFEDGYGLSVGPSKKLKGYANILSLAHNDLFDYSKIKAPKSTARGLVANGKLLLEETSLTNKDTLKRAAVVEQYLVAEMAKQVHGKFGLSAERSLKIAKAANHFRKFSSKRVLTNEDTNAYMSEIIGADMKTVEKAFESSMKGDVSNFKSVLEKAAVKNGTSPEKMAEIVTELFI